MDRRVEFKKHREYLKMLAKKLGVTFPNRNSMMLAAGRVFGDICLIMIDEVLYYQFFLECPRKSGDATDKILIRVRQENGNALKHVQEGTELFALGSLRSKDWTDDKKVHHLELFMEACHFEFSTSMLDPKMDNEIIILKGCVCKTHDLKVSGSASKKDKKENKVIFEYNLAVENENFETDHFPMSAWGGMAPYMKAKTQIGDRFIIWGRLFSRVYFKKDTEEEKIAYEVSTFYTYFQNKPNQQRQNRGSV